MKRPSPTKLKRLLRVRELPDNADHQSVRTFVTDWLVKKYDLGTEDEINRGYCFIWAYLVWALCKPGTMKFVGDSSHVCVKIGDKFYDSVWENGTFDKRNILGYRFRGPWNFSTLHLFLYWGYAGYEKLTFRSIVKRLTGEDWGRLVARNAEKLSKYDVDIDCLLDDVASQ